MRKSGWLSGGQSEAAKAVPEIVQNLATTSALRLEEGRAGTERDWQNLVNYLLSASRHQTKGALAQF